MYVSNPFPSLPPPRKKLRDFFAGRLEFKVIELSLEISPGVGKEEEGRESHEQRLSRAFYTNVTSKCTEEAIVVVYISGIQFPLRTDPVSRFTFVWVALVSIVATIEILSFIEGALL